MAGLDLENGDEALADASPAERRRAARKAASEGKSSTSKSSSSTRTRTTATERVEQELASRLDRTFDRIAVALDARNDAELAEIIREDKAAMGQGLVSLTRSVKFLRSPLLMALNLIEPALAFGRVGRVLYVRWATRQARIAQERQEAANAPVPGGVTASPDGTFQ